MTQAKTLASTACAYQIALLLHYYLSHSSARPYSTTHNNNLPSSYQAININLHLVPAVFSDTFASICVTCGDRNTNPLISNIIANTRYQSAFCAANENSLT